MYRLDAYYLLRLHSFCSVCMLHDKLMAYNVSNLHITYKQVLFCFPFMLSHDSGSNDDCFFFHCISQEQDLSLNV